MTFGKKDAGADDLLQCFCNALPLAAELHEPRSMDQSLLTAAAGLRSRMETLEVLGNNIANANTASFKRAPEFYNLFLGAEAEADRSGEVTWMPVVEGSAIDFTQAVL